jgi:two-component system response regulator DesR
MTRDDGAGAVRVLIADANAGVRTALRRFLSASPGFDVVADTGSTAAALELARQHAPSVAIVGVQLRSTPGGLECLEGIDLLRAITGELHVPAVALSTQGGLRRQALAAGACQFLEKDGSPDLLLLALRAAAGR